MVHFFESRWDHFRKVVEWVKSIYSSQCVQITHTLVAGSLFIYYETLLGCLPWFLFLF